MEGGLFTAFFCWGFCSLSIIGIAIVLTASHFKATRSLATAIFISGLSTGIIFTVWYCHICWGDIFSDYAGWIEIAVYLIGCVFSGMFMGFGIGSVTSSIIAFPIVGIIALIRSWRGVKKKTNDYL